jgi:tRNA (guanine-N7-)-methyltransferase
VSSQPAEPERPSAGIRSYVLRRSHFSPAQRDAYRRLMPVFGVPFSRRLLDLAALFGRRAPTILEIGFGMGETTAEIAAANPDKDYLGVEVHTPGVGALLKQVDARGLRNLRVIEHDVQEVLAHQVPDEYLTGIHVFFPDPWPKVRHHKRRLIQQQFVNKLTAKLRPGGYLHLATDWPDYALQMEAVVAAVAGLTRVGVPEPPPAPLPAASPAAVPIHASPAAPPALPDGGQPIPFVDGVSGRPVTKFEKRGLNLGHPISDVIAVKNATRAVPAP